MTFVLKKMETKTEIKGGPTRRKSTTKCEKLCAKEERNASLKKVSVILQKPEEERTLEEQQVLNDHSELVIDLKSRWQRRDELKKRMEEWEEPIDILQEKALALAQVIAQSEHLVIYTGAGISTAARIPDYRGKNGIWTRLQQGKDIGNHDLSLAEPTYTHMALSELYSKNILKYVVSQNCDGLHLRSGLPRTALSELHGNMYIEVCKNCKPVREYWRLFDVTENTARFSHKTMRRCYKCNQELTDTIVHFGERGTLQWPLNWKGACTNADKADTIICLGSSLKVLKRYPWLWQMSKTKQKRPNLYIVNLQWTPKDDHAVLKINGKCDVIMKMVMKHLGIEVPEYERENDPIFAHATMLLLEEMHTTNQPFLKENLTDDCENTENTQSSNEISEDFIKKEIDNKDDSSEFSNNLCLKTESNDTINHEKELIIDDESKFPTVVNSVEKNKTKSEKNDAKFNDTKNIQNISNLNSQYPYIKIDKDANFKEISSQNISLKTENLEVKIEDANEIIKSQDNFETEISATVTSNQVNDDNLDQESNQNEKISETEISVSKSSVKENESNSLLTLSQNEKKSPHENFEAEIITSITSDHDDFQEKVENLEQQTVNQNIESEKSKVGISENHEILNMKNENSEQVMHNDNFKAEFKKNLDKNVETSEQTDSKQCEASSALNKMSNKEILGHGKKEMSETSSVEIKCEKNLTYFDQTEAIDYSKQKTSTNTLNNITICDKNTHSSIKTSRLTLNGTKNCTLSDTKTFTLPKRKIQTINPPKTANIFSIDNILNKNTNSEQNKPVNPVENFQTLMAYYANTILQNQMLGYVPSSLYPLQTSFLYPGLHSIINPMPFINYDFNTITPNLTPDVNKIDLIKKEPEIPKEPSCKFCFDRFKAYNCLYYSSVEPKFVKELFRFSKIKNCNTLLVCICCDYTTEEEESSDDECKKKKIKKILNENDESDSIKENVEKESLSDTDDINIEDKKVDNKSKIQAGWFGKGYRKNRYKKKIKNGNAK